MASTASPYGFKPVNEIGGLPYAGSTRSFALNPAGYGTNIFNGSLVYVATTGYLQLVTADGSDGTTNAFPAGTTLTGAVGVFVGCSYVNAQGQTIFSQYYPASALNAVAFVVDDPNTVFQAQANGQLTIADLGANVTLANAQSTSTGSTTTGNSNVALSSTSKTTTAPFRVIGFPNMVGFSVVGDAYTDVFVKWNPGWHSYTNVVGL
jgi:hypothetical protein